MNTQSQIVSEDEADIRLDRWFRRHFPGTQQSLIQKFCRTGQIRVDGARVDTNTRLAPGQSITIFDKVTAPSGALVGVVDATTLTVTTANGTYTSGAPGNAVATDSTTVIAGNVSLVKTQGLDAACSGTPSGGYVLTTITTGAIPGACIDYQITVQNLGSANATAVTVSDATPAFTILSTAPAVTLGAITAPIPAVGSAGTVTATVGTLTPGQSAVLTFGVKIQP